jgi:hypothetical protein
MCSIIFIAFYPLLSLGINYYILLAFPGQPALILYTLSGSSLSYKPRSAYHDDSWHMLIGNIFEILGGSNGV